MGLTGFQRRRRELAAKEAAAREAAEKEAASKSKTIDEMTVPELKQYATDNEIDLGAAKKKADILEIIRDWVQGQETLKLRDQAVALGIENVEEKDLDTLTAEIAATQTASQEDNEGGEADGGE